PSHTGFLYHECLDQLISQAASLLFEPMRETANLSAHDSTTNKPNPSSDMAVDSPERDVALETTMKKPIPAVAAESSPTIIPTNANGSASSIATMERTNIELSRSIQKISKIGKNVRQPMRTILCNIPIPTSGKAACHSAIGVM